MKRLFSLLTVVLVAGFLVSANYADESTPSTPKPQQATVGVEGATSSATCKAPDSPAKSQQARGQQDPALETVQQLGLSEDQLTPVGLGGGCTNYCPAVGGCGPSGCYQAFPPNCTTSNTGMTNCKDANGCYFCGPHQTIRIRNCDCDSDPGAVCLNQNQSWFCQ